MAKVKSSLRYWVERPLVIFFWKFPLLAWAAWQLQYSPTAWELSENSLQNLRNKWSPHLVFFSHLYLSYLSGVSREVKNDCIVKILKFSCPSNEIVLESNSRAKSRGEMQQWHGKNGQELQRAGERKPLSRSIRIERSNKGGRTTTTNFLSLKS